MIKSGLHFISAACLFQLEYIETKEIIKIILYVDIILSKNIYKALIKVNKLCISKYKWDWSFLKKSSEY